MNKILYVLLFFSFQVLALEESLEEGNECSKLTKLPSNFVCFNETVFDCNQSHGNVMGYVACGGAEIEKVEEEFDMRYKSLLEVYQKPAKYGQDLERAYTSLTESQKIWEQFVSADCNLEDSLFGEGNAIASAGIDCHLGHLKERVERLKYLQEYSTE